jgi:hypothetical protein
MCYAQNSNSTISSSSTSTTVKGTPGKEVGLSMKNVKQLAKDLEAAGVSLQRGKHHSKLELQCFAEKNRIPLRISRPVVKDGWLGKPKGLLQVLWEHGVRTYLLCNKFHEDVAY